MGPAGSDPPWAPSFFQDPADAVEQIRDLLKQRAWPELARYYDLEGSGIDPDALASGRYFFDPDQAVGHPSTRGWMAPFPPAFSYLGHEVEDDLATVEVGLEVDQGDGMLNRAIDTFQLRRHPEGWQLIPGKVR